MVLLLLLLKKFPIWFFTQIEKRNGFALQTLPRFNNNEWWLLYVLESNQDERRVTADRHHFNWKRYIVKRNRFKTHPNARSALEYSFSLYRRDYISSTIPVYFVWIWYANKLIMKIDPLRLLFLQIWILKIKKECK